MALNLQDTLLAYSEWLDGEGLVVGDKEGDSRSHDQLVLDFISQWEGKPLVGQEELPGIVLTRRENPLVSVPGVT
jgi:hypothetical protein